MCSKANGCIDNSVEPIFEEETFASSKFGPRLIQRAFRANVFLLNSKKEAVFNEKKNDGDGFRCSSIEISEGADP